jgi:hypothetical protein
MKAAQAISAAQAFKEGIPVAANLFTFVGLYGQGLTTLGHVLDKGAELAKSKGVSADEMLDWRLVDDMNPLRFQAYVCVNFAKQWPARVAGVPAPADVPNDLDFAGVKASVEEAKRFLGALKPEQFEGRDDIPLTWKMGTGMEPTFPSAQWLTGFATTNFYFHLSMAYAILRQRGADLGKRDMFAGGL